MSLQHINNSIPDFIALSNMKSRVFEDEHENLEEGSRNTFYNFSKYVHENKTPKILIMSLEAMYKTIQDTYETNPIVCCKFLQSILTYLESLQPGDWVSECDDIIDYLFKLLLGIVQTIDMQTSRVINRSRSMTSSISHSAKNVNASSHCLDDCLQSFDCHISIQKKLCNIATACLFSIGIAKGNISMLLVAVNTVLIRNGLVEDNDLIQTPSLVLKLKNLSDLALTDSELSTSEQFSLINPLPENINSGPLTSNGTHMFWLTTVGLLKIGTGFNGSIKGFVYLTNEELAKYCTGWMGIVSNSILLHSHGSLRSWKLGDNLSFSKINIETLQIEGQVNLRMTNFIGCPNYLGWKYYIFSNSFRLGISLINEDDTNSEQLYLKMFKLTSDKFLLEECEKSIDMTQHLIWRIEVEQPKTFSNPSLLIETSPHLSLACEALNLEEFCVVRNQSGEIFYKDVDNTERNNNVENWSRLLYNDYIAAKFNKLIGGIDNKFICAISDDGLWRISVNKHSQPRTLCLDRLMSNSRFLSKTWISGSCSKDNLALVSKEGQVLFLEKDSIHSLSTCYGALLSPYHVTQISLGKSHGACLSRNGYLITFGVNNYNQCGCVTENNDGKYNEMIHEMDNNNTDNCNQIKSKHQVATIKPQKLLIYSESNATTGIRNRSNFLRIQQVSCGSYHTVLLTIYGDVYSFGNNKCNQLGRGFLSNKELPKAIALQTKAVRITTGPFSTGILTQAGKVLIFGSKLITPLVIDAITNPTELTDNLQPIFFNLSSNIHKKQIIFCILKQNICNMKKKSTNLSISNKTVQQDQFRFVAKDNHILLTSVDQRCLLIDLNTNTIRIISDCEGNTYNPNSNACFDPRYSVVWTMEQSMENKKFTMKFNKNNIFRTDNVISKVDPLIDLSDDLSFSSQRYRIALNVLVSAERLLLKRYTDPQVSIDMKIKQLNKDIFTVKRFTKENSNWLYSPNAHDSIKFSVSEFIYLHGVGLYTGSGENTMCLKIYEETGHDSDTDELLNTNLFSYDNQFSSLLLLTETDKIDIQVTDNKKIIQAMLPSPIIIFPNKFYVIVVKITGDSTDFGFHGKSKIDTDLGITFKFKQSKNSSNGTHVKEGQIPEIYYSPKIPDTFKIIPNNFKNISLTNASNVSEYLSSQISMNSLTSAVALLNWIYTGLTCMFSELPDLHSDPNSKIYSFKLLKCLETLKLYSRAFSSTLKIIRKHIQHLYPFNGFSKDSESHEISVVIGDFRIIVRNIFLECKICHYLQLIKATYGPNSLIFLDCWKIFTDLVPVYKETLENSFHAFYPEIEDQRFTIQEALTKVYEFCFNKSTDTLCNYGKIIFLTSLLTAVNSINDGSLLFTQKDNSISRSGVENKMNHINTFSDRFPLLREYMRTIWKPSSRCSSDILSTTSTMIHCLLAIITLDITKTYKPCRSANLVHSTDIDVEERKIFEIEMTNLINAAHLILTNITHLLVDQLNQSAKFPTFHMSQVNSTNSKTNGQTTNQQYLNDIILTTQSRFKRVIWIDKASEISGPKTTEQTANGTEQEIEDVICFNISKTTNQFINGFEVIGDNIIYLEGIKVYCSNFNDSRCSAYIYRTNNFLEGITENWQLIPMEYEWKNEEHDLIASDLIFKRKLKLEETYRYAVKIFLTTSNSKKILVGQHPVTKLDARFGFRFNLFETELRTVANQNSGQGTIFSLLYSFSTRPISTIDNQRLERRIIKMCLIEMLAQVKYALVAMVKETNPDENLGFGQKLFVDNFLPFFCHKLQLVSNVSKKITCLSITFVRESLPIIHEYWKPNEKSISQEKDYLTIIESNHPYEPAKLIQNTIKFPNTVQAISISFDSHCITSQPEDYLTIKTRYSKSGVNESEKQWKIVFKSLSNVISEWPKKAIIIQGNEVYVEFHTASLYEESLESTYGFKCSIVGHCPNNNASIELMENSLTYLASKCAESLLEFRKKSKVVKLLHDTNILQKCEMYRNILDQGLSLSRLPTLTDCLNKSTFEYVNSIQTTFIKKFVEGSNYSSESCSSPAIQLAKWLQSCSVVVVGNCRLKMTPTSISTQYLDEFKNPTETNIVGSNITCELNKEVRLQLELVDQYENRVYSQICNIDVVVNYNHKGNNPFININEKLFGGHPVPNTTIPFENTIIGKDVYQSITMMKNYELYSFEEIRAAGLQENINKSQNIKCRWNEEDGFFYIDWITKICGQFHLLIKIDNIILKNSKSMENYTLKLDVIKKTTSENGPVEKIRKKTDTLKDKTETPKYLWFEGKQSSGLRVRSQPSFNSPVLGIIPCNTVLRYEEELFTENSVWVRLHFDSFHQWYGYYPADPLDQRPVISIEPNLSKQELQQIRKKSVTTKPQIKASGFCKKTVKSNMKPFTEGWCLKEHLNKVFLTPAKLNYTTETIQKENLIKILSENNTQINTSPFTVCSKTLPTKRRSSARSNQSDSAKYFSNSIAISLPNSPEMALKRKSHNKLVISSSASSSQPTSPGLVRRRSNKTSNSQKPQITSLQEALSPLQAETQRALFASMIWQNGLVSDLIQIAESINLYSAYQQLEKQVNNSNNTEDNRNNIPSFDTAQALSNAITRSNSQNTGDMSLLSDSCGVRTFSITATPRIIPSLADLVANAVAATSNSMSTDPSPTTTKSPPRQTGSIKRSQSHMDGRTIQTGQTASAHHRGRFYSQVKEEEARKLGLHVSLDEELLNIGKPSSSSNCKINDNLQFEIITKLNQLTKLWDTISAILILSEQQSQFNKTSTVNETIQVSGANSSFHDDQSRGRQLASNFYQRVYDNSMLLLGIEPCNLSMKMEFTNCQKDQHVNSKIIETNRVLSPSNEEDLTHQSRNKYKQNTDSCFTFPNSSKYFPESEIDISRSNKSKSTSPTKMYSNFWPLHNLQKAYTFGNNNAIPDDINEQICASIGCDDSSIYLKCDCWSCLPLLKESEHRAKANFSSGNLTETSIPNSSVGTAFASTAIKQHLLKLSKTVNSSWEHTVITSSDSNSTSIKPLLGSSAYYKSSTMVGQLLQSMMSLLVNIVASSSSGMEIFDRSMTGSNIYKKDCSTRGLLEMRFCLCYSFFTELKLALQISLRTLIIEQYSYQTYFWLMENVKCNSSTQIVIWCLYNLLQQQASANKSNNRNIDLIEEKRIKMCSQQLWAVGSTVFYRLLDNIVHNFNLNNLSVSEIKLLEMIVKLSSLLLFSDSADDPFSQSFMNFEKSQVFSCLSELLNHLDDHKTNNNKSIVNHDNSLMIQSPTDITAVFNCHVTSNIDTATALFDNNTDIFWESSGSNTDQYPCIMLKLNQKSASNISSDHIVVAIYLDRTRDVVNGQITVTVRLLKTAIYQQINVEPDHIGWISFHLEHANQLENGINIGFHVTPDDEIHTSAANGILNDKIRVRSVKVFDASEFVSTAYYSEDDQMKLRYELLKEETLKSFIEMTNHIFYNCFTTSYQNKIEKKEVQETIDIETKSLHDFLVNILFDTGFKSEIISSRLSNLQRRVLSHIITQINVEVTKMLIDRQDGSIHISDNTEIRHESLLKKYDPSKCSCCFQLLNQVLALSGAQAGLRYLIHQAQLIRDLIILLYVGSDKIRQQVLFAITRIFSAVSPRSLEDILVGVLQSPENEQNANIKMKMEKSFLPLNLLMIFAGKSLNIQIKSKANVSQNVSRPFNDFLFRLSNIPKFIQTANCDLISANKIYQLIYKLSDENNHAAWFVYVQEWLRDIFESFISINQTLDPINWDVPNLYFLICLLPLFENIKLANFWNNLSSTARVLKSGDKKMCTNHDDESTLATVICYTCQPLLTIVDSSDVSFGTRLVFLCGECDRYLHLSKMTKYHIRDNLTTQMSTTRENLSMCDCIVSSQENCVRLKSNKFIVTVDISTLKILINLSQNSTNNLDVTKNNLDIDGTKTIDQEIRCRFCNEHFVISDNKFVCSATECQMKNVVACHDKVQPCGHWCLGVVIPNVNGSIDRKICPPICIAPGCSNQSTLSKIGLKQDGDDVCMICFTDTLFEGPIIILDNCRHMLHYHCARRQIQAGWPGYRVTFNFRKCPFCKQKMEHPALQDLLEPYDILEKEVKRKALLRLEHEGLIDSPEMKDADGTSKESSEEFALNKYCYYLCYKCKNSYYGGEARCEPDVLLNPQINQDRMLKFPVMDPATELCCAACSDVAQAKICPKHSTDFLEYKCRYCCSVAVFFCFGTTHFCQRCHDNLDMVLKATWLPQCPAGPALQHFSSTECPLHVIHPPTGEEFALGCALCRKLDTF